MIFFVSSSLSFSSCPTKLPQCIKDWPGMNRDAREWSGWTRLARGGNDRGWPGMAGDVQGAYGEFGAGKTKDFSSLH